MGLQQSPGSRMAAPAVLLLSLGAVRSLPQPQGYWWMGNSGSFGDVADGDIPAEDYSVDDDYNSNANGGYASAGYGPPARPPVISSEAPARAANGDPAGDVSSLGQLSNDINERNTNFAEFLPVTECAIGWKCVNELFCDESGSMVAFRVDLTPKQKKKRGTLVPCMNQALGKLEVCCKGPPTAAQVATTPRATPPPPPPVTTTALVTTPTPPPGSCPPVTSLPPLASCAGRQSNCWSVGTADLDRLDDAFCCFDGCANVCMGRGPISGNPGPQNNPRPAATLGEIIAPPPQPVQQLQQPQPADSKTSAEGDFVFPDAANIPVGPVEDFGGSGAPSSAATFELQQQQPQQQPQQQQQPAPVVVPSPSSPIEASTPTPYTQCPSAMKCVPKSNCDFNGIMVNFAVRLTAAQEERRVPLITCFNTARGNAVDVCCRDPNYKDPWPDMDRSGATQASAPAPASQFQVIDNSPTQALEQHLAAQKNNQQKQTQNNKNRRPGYGK